MRTPQSGRLTLDRQVRRSVYKTPMATALIHELFGSSTPCRASERGCSGSDILGVFVLVALAAGVIVCVLAWIWFRWERGPFPLLMSLLDGWRRR
jgi:hypothetical protein